MGLSHRRVLAFACLIVTACEGMARYTEDEAIVHFKQHREQFVRLVELFRGSGEKEFEAVGGAQARDETDVGDKRLDAEMARLSHELAVVWIGCVPSSASRDEQWVQIRLEGRPSAPYGLIYVPQNRPKALAALRSEVPGPPRVYLRMRELPSHWFYFEYQ